MVSCEQINGSTPLSIWDQECVFLKTPPDNLAAKVLKSIVYDSACFYSSVLHIVLSASNPMGTCAFESSATLTEH